MADIEMKLSIKELRVLLMATTVHLNIKTRKLVDAESSRAYTAEAIRAISKETEALIALISKPWQLNRSNHEKCCCSVSCGL